MPECASFRSTVPGAYRAFRQRCGTILTPVSRQDERVRFFLRNHCAQWNGMRGLFPPESMRSFSGMHINACTSPKSIFFLLAVFLFGMLSLPPFHWLCCRRCDAASLLDVAVASSFWRGVRSCAHRVPRETKFPQQRQDVTSDLANDITCRRHHSEDAGRASAPRPEYRKEG